MFALEAKFVLWKGQPNSQSCNFMKPQKALLKGSDLNTHCEEINSLRSHILFNPSPTASYKEENAVVQSAEEKDER